MRTAPLIPAQAGIQFWVPACAGTSGTEAIVRLAYYPHHEPRLLPS